MGDGKARKNFGTLIRQVCMDDPRFPRWSCDDNILTNTYTHLENQAHLKCIRARMSTPKDNDDFAQYFRFTGRSGTTLRIAPCFVLVLILILLLSLTSIILRLM
jgi:hypothetical protein